MTFDPVSEGPQIAHALDMFQYQLKGVSLLPRAPLLAYPQLPYEAISEERFKELTSQLKPLQLTLLKGPTPSAPDNYCDGDKCSA